ncbi:MAG: hypothetical protein LUE89_00030 [Clostridiales bacterium]|nr:hypothetical protein [Clostridiales bacterium]
MTAQDYVERIKKANVPEEVQAIVTRAQYDDDVSHYGFIDVLAAAGTWEKTPAPPAVGKVVPLFRWMGIAK